MKILWLDDEEHKTSEYRNALVENGFTVTATKRIWDAVDELKASFYSNSPDFNLVLIDLMLPGQPVGATLQKSYMGLVTREHNEGQALGQWLWETEGAKQIHHRPMHCYFTNGYQFYSQHRVTNQQEFLPENASDFILHKTSIKPSNIADKLRRVHDQWIKMLAADLA
jgi:hypothetical protein